MRITLFLSNNFWVPIVKLKVLLALKKNYPRHKRMQKVLNNLFIRKKSKLWLRNAKKWKRLQFLIENRINDIDIVWSGSGIRHFHGSGLRLDPVPVDIRPDLQPCWQYYWSRCSDPVFLPGSTSDRGVLRGGFRRRNTSDLTAPGVTAPPKILTAPPYFEAP